MSKKKKVLIVGKDPDLDSLSEKMFNLGGFETIICRKKRKVHKLKRTEADTIERVFYPKK